MFCNLYIIEPELTVEKTETNEETSEVAKETAEVAKETAEVSEKTKNLNTVEETKNLTQKQTPNEDGPDIPKKCMHIGKEEASILVYKITHCSNKCIKSTVCSIKKNVSVDYSTMNEDNDIILMKDIHGYFQDIVLENQVQIL